MKLISCYISSFGKLVDFKYDFGEGYNVILEENGWGKSTFATFIKSMFYGLSGDGKKKNLDDRERVKYKPWATSNQFGGNLVFERDGKRFKIEKTFGKNEGEDTCFIYDLESGRKHIADGKTLGNRLFGIDENGFLSTACFSGKDIEVGENTSIISKLNGGAEENSTIYDKAVDSLEKKMKAIKLKKGNGGEYAEVKDNIFALTRQISVIEEQQSNADLLKNSIKELSQREQSLKRETETLSQEVGLAGRNEAIKIKQERYKSALEQRDAVRQKLAQTEKFFNGYKPRQQQLDACKNIYRDYLSADEKERKLILEVQSAEAKVEGKKPKTYLLWIIGGLFISLAIILWFALYNLVVSLILGAIGVLGSIMPLFFLGTRGQGSDKEGLEKTRTLLNQCRDIKVVYSQKLAEFLGIFGYDFDENIMFNLGEISSRMRENEELIETLNSCEKQIEMLAQDQDVFANQQQSEKNAIQIGERLKYKQTEYSEVSRELAFKKATLSRMEEEVDKLFDLRNQLDLQKQRLQQLEDDFNLLDKTLSFMLTANANMKNRFRLPLENSMNKYLSLIEGKSINNARIDADLCVSVEENGVNKEEDYYSKGYRNLYEICKRFALVDVLFTDEKPFIILDDPFTNLDKNKIENSVNLLKQLSKEFQIIYFSCHQSRA